MSPMSDDQPFPEHLRLEYAERILAVLSDLAENSHSEHVRFLSLKLLGEHYGERHIIHHLLHLAQNAQSDWIRYQSAARAGRTLQIFQPAPAPRPQTPSPTPQHPVTPTQNSTTPTQNAAILALLDPSYPRSAAGIPTPPAPTHATPPPPATTPPEHNHTTPTPQDPAHPDPSYPHPSFPSYPRPAAGIPTPPAPTHTTPPEHNHTTPPPQDPARPDPSYPRPHFPSYPRPAAGIPTPPAPPPAATQPPHPNGNHPVPPITENDIRDTLQLDHPFPHNPFHPPPTEDDLRGALEFDELLTDLIRAHLPPPDKPP